jgi:hypothetical protein
MSDDPKALEEMMAKFPTDWWKHPASPRILAGWLRNYMIGLHLIFEVKGERGLKQVVFSGFALGHADRFAWATAGHIVDQLQELATNPNVKIHRAVWLDDWDASGKEQAIPVIGLTEKPMSTPMISGTPLNYDVGAVSLNDVKDMLLANRKLQIFREEGWRNRHSSQPEGYYLVGFPTDWCKTEAKADKGHYNTGVHAELVCVPVEKVERPQGSDEIEKYVQDHPDAFYGKVLTSVSNSGKPLADIDGLSGGMLLSIERRNGQMVYRLFGIQSAWFPKQRIIIAEPIEALTVMLERMDELEHAGVIPTT